MLVIIIIIIILLIMIIIMIIRAFRGTPAADGLLPALGAGLEGGAEHLAACHLR